MAIYFDHNATTPLLSEAQEAMTAAFAVWGNPSSVHAQGRAARDLVENARADVAALLGALPDEIVFTSGGTEADNLGIRGLARAEAMRRGLLVAAGGGAAGTSRPHVVTSALEHPAVHGAVDELRAMGFEVTVLTPDVRGDISLDVLAAALRPDGSCCVGVGQSRDRQHL